MCQERQTSSNAEGGWRDHSEVSWGHRESRMPSVQNSEASAALGLMASSSGFSGSLPSCYSLFPLPASFGTPILHNPVCARSDTGGPNPDFVAPLTFTTWNLSLRLLIQIPNTGGSHCLTLPPCQTCYSAVFSCYIFCYGSGFCRDCAGGRYLGSGHMI